MTLKECQRFVSDCLTQAAIPNAMAEARWLIAEALEKENSFLILNPDYALSSAEEIKIKEWASRRLQGEPLSRLRGTREFWSLSFFLNEHTLDPRPDTEILIEGVLNWVGKKTDYPWTILDLGTGSGCLLITLLTELKRATGIAVDKSEEALAMARFNANYNAVGDRSAFQQGNWGEGLNGTLFDIIVSNPPYIPLIEKNSLEKGVLHFDPTLALFGGDDGLDCYRALSQQIGDLLSPNGLCALEIGCGQRQDVESLFHQNDFETVFVLKDLAGIERVLGLRKSF